MRNITVSVPEEVYRAARIRAAEEGRSVSGMVAAYLRSVAGRGTEFARLEAQQRRIQSQITNSRASDRLGRDDAHDQAAGLIESWCRLPLQVTTMDVMRTALATRQRFGISYWTIDDRALVGADSVEHGGARGRRGPTSGVPNGSVATNAALGDGETDLQR